MRQHMPSFLCLLGFLAYAGALALPIRNHFPRLTAAEIGANFEKEGFNIYPDLPEPTDEEWIAMIEGKATTYNFTLCYNQTGSFDDHTRVNGTWEGRTYLKYWEEDEGKRPRASGQAVLFLDVDKAHFARVTRNERFYTYQDDGDIVVADIHLSAFFDKKDGNYSRTGGSLTYVNGVLKPDQMVLTQTMTLKNESNNFSLDISFLTATSTIDETLGDLLQYYEVHHIPFVSEQGTKDPVVWAQLFQNNHHVSSSYGFLFGACTVGQRGDLLFTAGAESVDSEGEHHVTAHGRGNYAFGKLTETEIGVREHLLLSGFTSSPVSLNF